LLFPRFVYKYYSCGEAGKIPADLIRGLGEGMDAIERKQQGVRVGTSGWHYAHWRGNFYPADLPANRWLAYYAEQFQTVEINNSFYQLPGEETFRQWHAQTPPGFVFAVKASRFITHMKKLSDPQASTAKFFERVALLGEKLGPILFQLPPRWRPNLERLETFLAALPSKVGHRYAFEFRDPAWLTPAVYEVLARHNAALCIYHFNGRSSPKELTADFTYLRLHGPGGPYQGKYSPDELAEWARECLAWRGRDIFCYFDNDMAGYAPQNARELIEALGRIPAGTSFG
jgi:uncharacterized protein YecE (DUF72 family)